MSDRCPSTSGGPYVFRCTLEEGHGGIHLHAGGGVVDHYWLDSEDTLCRAGQKHWSCTLAQGHAGAHLDRLSDVSWEDNWRDVQLFRQTPFYDIPDIQPGDRMLQKALPAMDITRKVECSPPVNISVTDAKTPPTEESFVSYGGPQVGFRRKRRRVKKKWRKAPSNGSLFVDGLGWLTERESAAFEDDEGMLGDYGRSSGAWCDCDWDARFDDGGHFAINSSGLGVTSAVRWEGRKIPIRYVPYDGYEE